MGNLQALARAYDKMSDIAGQAQAAYGQVLAAKDALAEKNFDQGAAHFNEAEQLLNQARADFDQALAASKTILSWVDVTGTVRTADKVLAAASEVARAGERLSSGLQPLMKVKLDAGPGEKPVVSLVDTLANLREEVNYADQALTRAQTDIAQAGSLMLPSEIQNQVRVLKEIIPKAQKPLHQFNEQSQVLWRALGAERQRQYLLLFENNSEQRPTGGFIGSIALINVDRGRVENVKVDTVYNPDGQLKEFVAPPEPLTPINNRWFLRDSNWFADYAVSAQKAADFFEKEGGPSVDGVIAMTPEVIKELLEITGPIDVPGYDVKVTADNFVPLTQDLVTFSYDRASNQPKQFLKDLTPILLSKVFGQTSENAPRLLAAIWNMIREKQLLIYFTNPDETEKVGDLGLAAPWPKDQAGFFSVINANIGGHKSDQFIEQEIDYRAELKKNGAAEVLVTIRRAHRGPEEQLDYNYPPDENPALKDNIIYQRVFVPNGARLLDAQGYNSPADVPRQIFPETGASFTADPDVAEWQRQQTVGVRGTIIGKEAGYAYFANWIITKPGATTVTTYRYLLPAVGGLPNWWSSARPFGMYAAKQPGDTRTTLRAEITLPENVRVVHTVPHDGITQPDARHVIFRGALKTDQLVGVVAAK